jgi:murein DD-endopeptidase MepM/ murein hydrolase activator NlpD
LQYRLLVYYDLRMKRILHSTRPARLATIALSCGLATACSTYQPLGRGSDVPWAAAGQTRSAAAAAERSGRRGELSQPEVIELAGDEHRVRAGDRLSTLARTYRVSVRALAEANRLEAPYVIYVGQRLRIPGHTTSAPEPVLATLGDRYVVQRGDTLSGIARRIDVPMVQLAAANQIASPYQLYAGQKLRLPDPDVFRIEPAAGKPTLAAAAQGTPPPLSGQGFLWPVNGKVIGGFGPIDQGQRRDGIDIAAREGAPVLAAEDALVAYAGEGIRGYGRLILLRHAEGYITTYGHNAALLVDVGERVARGQVIARVGSTGDASRSQLHFELRKGRTPIDPETVLVRDSTAVASTD